LCEPGYLLYLAQVKVQTLPPTGFPVVHSLPAPDQQVPTLFFITNCTYIKHW
jgi:hypothetical protein